MALCRKAHTTCASTCTDVGNDESVVRFILNPRHIEDPKTKKIRPNYIDLDEFRHGKGVSVYRLASLTHEELNEASSVLRGEVVVKFGSCRVQNVRSIITGAGDTCYMVCPTPRKTRPSHADIFWSNALGEVPDSLAIKFRKALIDAIGKLLPIDEIPIDAPNR